ASSQPNTASTSSDNSVHFTKTGSPGGGHGHIKPTVTINRAAGQADPTKTPAIKFRVVFSKLVNGFFASDVRLGGTAHPKHVVVTGGGRKYTLTVFGMKHGGTVRASIPAGVVTDVADNTNRASTSSDNTVTYNPTITLKTKHGDHISLSVLGGVLTVFKAIHSHIKPPPGTKAKWGEWTFTATSKKHAIVTFKLTLPGPPSSYLKLLNGQWKEFTWNGTTGARINGNVVTIKIRDNGRGDSNSTPGVVNDPGAPAISG
ncbi:MAG TPA: choice-of-anchor U domain-containing protein, partial [Jatrophihabitantaceae bacterium]|nr:choice-of-anchor U domain-containing protein [Jatrophihabitantaceae bacterium]